MHKTITSCLALAVTFTSATAFAQEFGDKGTFVVSADRLFGTYLTQVNPEGDGDTDATEIGLLWHGGGLTPYTIPRANVDYFVIDHLSVGGSVAFYNINGDFNGQLYGGGFEGNAFLFGPRVGGAWMFNDWAGIWPRGGFHYYSVGNGDGDHWWQLVFNAEAAFILSPWKNFAFTVGPAFDIGMTGKYVDDADPPGQPDNESYSVHAHSFGLLAVGVAGYFNL